MITKSKRMSEIQTTTTVRTTLPQSVFQSTKVPSSERKQCKRTDGDKIDVRDKREV